MQEKTRVQSLGREDPLEEGMASHSSILALENPMDRGAWGSTVHGVTKSGTQLSEHRESEQGLDLGDILEVKVGLPIRLQLALKTSRFI